MMEFFTQATLAQIMGYLFFIWAGTLLLLFLGSNALRR